MQRTHFAGIAAAAVIATLVLAACGGGSTVAQAPPSQATTTAATASAAGQGCSQPTKLTFRLNWVLDDEQIPYYTALDKGWYKDACLDLTIQPGQGSNGTVELVANGSADIGVADTVSVITGQAHGMGIMDIGILYQHNPSAILIRKAALTAAQVADPKPPLSILYGKTYGAVLTSSPYLFWRALVDSQHLDASQVHQVSISAPGFTEMATGKVDFITTFFTVVPVLEGQGVPVKVLKMEDYGQQGYGLSLFANQQYLAKHADAVRAFLSVTRRAIEYTNQNPEEGVKTLCKYNASLCNTTQALQTNVQEQLLTIPLYSNLDPGKPLLCGNLKYWQATEDLLQASGTITTEPDPSKSFTNEYLSGC